ncbi:alpha/beta hydrolase fold domain-containing protein [Nocardioides sp. CPCC 205120]|uniref:alpha/beta hydrolase fold domain-containing protein n=1 Tax=Nocardioides sp. CPCC 205120 TaxID=3406462 RepID=UPI003B50E2FF
MTTQQEGRAAAEVAPTVPAVDPEVLAGLTAAFTALADALPPTPPDQVDVASLRAGAAPSFRHYGSLIPARDDVTVTEYDVLRDDGTVLSLRWYAPHDAAPAPTPGRTAAAVFVHGGGQVAADLDDYDPVVRRYAGESGVPLLAVEYRLAPEHPAPAAQQDCLAALAFLHARADELGVDPDAVGVMGDSGGGGIAAATALAWRDQGRRPLAGQVLAYPMLDDRTREPDPALGPVVTWTHVANGRAWDAVLGGAEAGPDGYVAPARASDLAGLPPTYLDTGDLDLFRAEVLAFGARLAAAGVPLELHVVPGAVHAFDVVAPRAAVSRQVHATRYAALRRLARGRRA